MCVFPYTRAYSNIHWYYCRQRGKKKKKKKKKEDMIRVAIMFIYIYIFQFSLVLLQAMPAPVVIKNYKVLDVNTFLPGIDRMSKMYVYIYMFH